MFLFKVKWKIDYDLARPTVVINIKRDEWAFKIVLLEEGNSITNIIEWKKYAWIILKNAKERPSKVPFVSTNLDDLLGLLANYNTCRQTALCHLLGLNQGYTGEIVLFPGNVQFLEVSQPRKKAEILIEIKGKPW